MTTDTRIPYHYFAPTMPEGLRAFLCARSAEAWDELDRFPRGQKILERHGLRVEPLSGWYGSPDDRNRHVWLVVGDGLHLFDPTAAQFAEPPWSRVDVLPDNYLIQKRDFSVDFDRLPVWRAERLERSGFVADVPRWGVWGDPEESRESGAARAVSHALKEMRKKGTLPPQGSS